MLRLAVRLPTRSALLPSASSSSIPSCSFHTSSPTLESSKKQRSRLVKKKNLARRAELSLEAERTRPHVVLGHSAGQESLWFKSDLAKVLVSESEKKPLPLIHAIEGKALSDAHATKDAYPSGIDPSPKMLNFGLGTDGKKLVFEDLPSVSAKRVLLNIDPLADQNTVTAGYEESLAEQMAQSEQMARILSLSNASAGGIAFENRRRIVAAFSTPDKPNNTGQTEVQAALLTLRIRDMWAHMQRAPRDIHSRHSLRSLLHQRAKILKYLKRTDRNRYDALLPRIGVDPRAVEGEVILS